MVVAVPAKATAPARRPACTGLWVVVPTYNESANLGGLLTALRTAVPDAQVLVVDDASPDGTGELAAHRARSDEHLHVLHREGKTGLGQAYAAGFRAVLAAGATRVVQMDADGSHDPAAIPELLAAMDTHQADLVIGSRYVPGGSTPDWPLARRLLSRGGCAYARTILGLAVDDLTGGYKLWRRATLEAVLAAPLTVQGYGFQVELTYRALRTGARAVEVPICFRDRTAGESKMGMGMVREAVVRVPQLRRAQRVSA
jgi:dolichol-phosphate mannosyltransferase